MSRKVDTRLSDVMYDALYALAVEDGRAIGNVKGLASELRKAACAPAPRTAVLRAECRWVRGDRAAGSHMAGDQRGPAILRLDDEAFE